MYYVLTPREELLRHFPKGAVGAEIGVAEGAFAAKMLEDAEPSQLHLIDPWSHLEKGSDLLESADLLQKTARTRKSDDAAKAVPRNPEGEKAYKAVEKRFAGDERVKLHRQYSYKAVTQFEDGYFDFVYVDGNHQYEFVLRDLMDFAPKLKPGGLLFGHDFFEDPFAKAENYGVVDAVGVFLKRSDFRFLMLTWEPFSTYCLTRSLDGFSGRFLRNVLESDIQMIEYPDALVGAYRDKAYKRRDGTTKRIPSFINSPQFQLA